MFIPKDDECHVSFVAFSIHSRREVNQGQGIQQSQQKTGTMTSVHPPLPPSSDTESFQPRSHAASQSNVVVFDETINVDEDVTDFFDSRFKSREDLGNIKAILQQQTDIGKELQQQVKNHRMLAPSLA